MTMDTIYRIRVSGHLDDRWSGYLGGFSVQRHDDGTTVLVGTVVDQAALHGLLTRIRDLGLPLLSLSNSAGIHCCPVHARSSMLRPGRSRRSEDDHERRGTGEP